MVCCILTKKILKGLSDPGAKGGMGFGHSKLLKEFLSKNKNHLEN